MKLTRLLCSRFSSFQLPTVNFHLEKDCNYKCSFCFAHFKEASELLTKEKTFQLISALKTQGDVQKINFAGGEPFLNKNLGEYIQFAKELGIKTSIVTNASRMTKIWIENYGRYLDQVAISCDSQYDDVQKKLGRGFGDHVRITVRGLARIHDFNSRNSNYINVKLNTVVNQTNHLEDMSQFILDNRITRWKVLMILLIQGENDTAFRELSITEQQFKEFCQRHAHLKAKGVEIANEDNDLMIKSYIMIDPTGRFYQNTEGSKYIYSSNINDHGVKPCLEQVGFDLNKFIKRGGLYELKKPKEAEQPAAALESATLATLKL